MDLKQAKIILEKINRLYQSMTLDEKNIDIFEQDLMLSYIRQLYGAFSSEEATKESSGQKSMGATVPPLPKVPKAVEQKVAPAKPAPPPVVEVKKEVVAKPPVEEIPVEVPEEVLKHVAPEPVKVNPTPPAPKVVEPPQPVVAKVVPPDPEPVKVPKVEAVRPAVQTPRSSEADALFEHKEATDLSEKLSQMPVKDLTKAMGLNEKILTINELFGGDNKAFDETMSALNGLSNIHEARAYLTAKVISRYGWATKEKKKKARRFVNLIRRRYS
ncbi:MAG: hypothetical protein AAF990_16230 [Bacteroidota bacterium]